MQELYEAYEQRKEQIGERLREFSQVWKTADDEKIFEELCFCVLTANTSAKMCIKSIEKVGRILKSASQEQLAEELTGVYRYPNARSKYIVHNRNYLDQEHGFQLRNTLNSFSTPEEAREFLVNNIKGLGYKEASHFLRNIGFTGLCILDKHIINSLAEFGVLEEPSRPRSRGEYIEIEGKMRDFCSQTGIGVDEMDLLLWSMKTGEILK